MSDWDTVTFDNRGAKKKGQNKQQALNSARRGNGTSVVSSAKYGGARNLNHNLHSLDTARLAEVDDAKKHATVSLELKKLLQQERVKAGFRTQKDLATRCNMKPQIIGAYENGSAIPAPQVISKIERALRQANPEFVMGTLSKAQKGHKKKAVAKKR